jgi:hypothetical protein
MAQADFVVANGTGAAVRSDLNGQLAAIVSNNSGATEPATMYAYQWWADTTAGLLKIRNAANNAWVTVGTLADANLGLLSIAGGTLTGALLADDAGTAALPAIAFDGDPDSGIFRGGANELGIATNGVERVEFGTSEVVFNDGGADYDFRIEGDTNANLFFVDASAEAVGIGSSSPNTRLEVASSISTVPAAEDFTTTVGYFNNTYNNGTNGTTAYTVLRLRRDGVGGASYGNSVDFGLARYEAVGTNSRSRLDIRLGHGLTNTTDTTVMTLLSSGAVGIGTTDADARLTLCSSGSIGSNDSNFIRAATDQVIYNAATSSGRHSWELAGSEKARVDSSGRLLVGTSTISSGDGQIYVQQDANTRNTIGANNTASGTGSLGFIAFYRNGTFTGGISNTGSATAYNTSSDYRLKENVVLLTGASDRLQQIPVHRFNFIADPDTTVDGFIAHEVQTVVPECVTGNKDEVDDDNNPVYQGIDQSKLVPLLTAALQEAVAEIKALKDRVTALEAA